MFRMHVSSTAYGIVSTSLVQVSISANGSYSINMRGVRSVISCMREYSKMILHSSLRDCK